MAVGLDTGFDEFSRIDPVLIGDVTGNGRISALDASFVARKSVGLPQAERVEPRDETEDDGSPRITFSGSTPLAADDQLILISVVSDSADGRRSSPDAQIAREARAAQLSEYESLSAELDLSPGALALAWLLHQPGVVSTIIGPGTMTQLTSVLDVPDIALDAEVLTRLDEIFPPCGPAPEAYAW